LQQYGGWLAGLHPQIWDEVRLMARTAGKRFQFDFRPAIDALGLDYVIKQVGIKAIIDQIGAKRLIDELGLDSLLAHLTPSQRQELKRRLE
jgi:hypothetical protein